MRGEDAGEQWFHRTDSGEIGLSERFISALGKSFCLSEAQITHLYNENNHNTSMMGRIIIHIHMLNYQSPVPHIWR